MWYYPLFQKKPKVEPDIEFSEDSVHFSTVDDPLDHFSGIKEEDFEFSEKDDKTRIGEPQSHTNVEDFTIPTNAVGQLVHADDELDHFCKYLANKLKNYDKRTRAVVQHEISNIIFKADLGEFEN